MTELEKSLLATVALLEEKIARLDVRERDPYEGLDFKAGDRFIANDGGLWVCPRDGAVRTVKYACRSWEWTVESMRKGMAVERPWWPLRKV